MSGSRRCRWTNAAARARDLLDRAVAKRLESEVPLGAFLGQAGPSVIVALMQRCVQAPVRTFTIGFDVARYDERRYAPGRGPCRHAAP